MAEKPQFSVIIAAYNQKDYLLEAVRSVKAQTYPAHEIIVVIDGSTDGSSGALRATFEDVRIYEQRNYGKCVARNAGIALATGDWICLLDHDDLWHKDKLRSVANYLASHPDCQALNHPVWLFSEMEDGPQSCFGLRRDFVAKNLEECHRFAADNVPSTNDLGYLQIRGDSFRLLLERNRGVLSASVLRRETLIRAGCFCPMQANGEDWTMFVNVARLCEWHTLPMRLGFSRFHSAQDTNTLGASGLIILTGIANAWFTGRPLKEFTPGLTFLPELRKYGAVYRENAQAAFWGALSKRQFRLAALIRSVAALLLPRWIDWLYMHIPPKITWYLKRNIANRN